MQPFGPPDERPLRGLVESRIETYGGQHRASAQSTGSNLYARRGLVLDPGRLRLQDYVPFAKSSGQTRILSPMKFREPEPEKRLGSPFGAGPPHSPKLKEVTKAHELEMRLYTFSMFGMPRLPPEDRRHWEIGKGSDSDLTIEKSWKELVPGHKEMSRELCHQQEALWELLTTELTYIRMLKIMTDLLAAGLLNLQRVGLLIEVSAETLFGNVPSLIRAHRSFWEEVLGPTLGKTRASGQPLDPVSLQDGFLAISQRFQPYVQYCLRVKQTMAYAREQQDNNPLFRTFVQWCEKHKRSGRQMLGDLLIKPHQRITKYPLLLQAVLKRTPEAQARQALNDMLDVYLFLFSDVLLVTKPQRRADKAKVIRPPFMLEKLVCRPLRDPNSFLAIHLTDFQCVSSALIVHCPSAADRAQWLEKTQQAQHVFPVIPAEKTSGLLERLWGGRGPFKQPQPLVSEVPASLLLPGAGPGARVMVALQKLKAQEYVQQKRELLALYRDQDQESLSTRPSTPSPEGSQSSVEGRNSEFCTIIPHLVVTDDTDEDIPLVPDDTSDSGYSTLIPVSPKDSHSPLSRLRPWALRRHPGFTLSALDLRDVTLRPQPPDPQAPQRRSTPELPGEVIRRGSSLPRGERPAWSEEEDGTSVGGNVVVETLHRAQLRGQLPHSSTHTDSAGESPWASSEDEEEEGPLFRRPSPGPLSAEDMLREIREELASQRIEGSPEPGDSGPRKLTRVQLQRMRGPHIIRLDTPVSTSEV
ncbi:pleckstrin homology domain-containing family G member 6 isoform X6 [Myotis myotis]|uniref:pleckstrin homology domain-containing family G member 6 isoform X6 n=1 Tax=Myotis myotis TaxID=51298 RepID=UPI001749F7A3|nr:pleckstrin homology domain-containing family G member 6 isoform X6 [Myotis myotis]